MLFEKHSVIIIQLSLFPGISHKKYQKHFSGKQKKGHTGFLFWPIWTLLGEIMTKVNT